MSDLRPPVLGLDVGDRRIGVAASDALGLAAHGRETIQRRGVLADDVAAVRAACESEGAARVVVGLPLNMDGSAGGQAQKTLAFVEALRAALAVPVETWDERLTTWEAERRMREAELSRAERRASVDRLAAAILLQDWLDAHRPPDAHLDSGPQAGPEPGPDVDA